MPGMFYSGRTDIKIIMLERLDSSQLEYRTFVKQSQTPVHPIHRFAQSRTQNHKLLMSVLSAVFPNICSHISLFLT
jgi:hypothetical protein